ncbi:MAG: ATP-grasp domain-containing protein [Verrucomicrobiota bacterium]
MPRDQFIIEDLFWILTEHTGISVYDYNFRQFFHCRTPHKPTERLPGIARIGAFVDYPTLFSGSAREGIDLVHTPDEHLRCTSLPIWYPFIENHTPRSRWYSDIPSFDEIESEFSLPVFVKGSRQTSKHRAEASVIRSRTDFVTATANFRSDPILHWQDFVCRELLPLRPVSGGAVGKVPASFEFRTFWWRGELVGSGRYWFEADDYTWTKVEQAEALEVAQQAVTALDCTFLVVDLAQTIGGEWVIIECNDGMESGYAGASPFSIWQNIIDCERRLTPTVLDK